MGYVYLIGEMKSDGKFKIGSTKAKNINKRIKQLQTGNSEQLYLRDYFETDRPFKLETMLHNRFKEFNTVGEWFELPKKDVHEFRDVCKFYQKIINELKENPFF